MRITIYDYDISMLSFESCSYNMYTVQVVKVEWLLVEVSFGYKRIYHSPGMLSKTFCHKNKNLNQSKSSKLMDFTKLNVLGHVGARIKSQN